MKKYNVSVSFNILTDENMSMELLDGCLKDYVEGMVKSFPSGIVVENVNRTLSDDEELEDLEEPFKPKYDLKPFDRILVRDEDNQSWACALFEKFDYENGLCQDIAGDLWYQYVPYEGHEHLLGTSYPA